MTEDRRSKLALYSLGVVVEDKPDGVNEITVYPVEELPHIDGKVADHAPKYDVAVPDAGGVEQKTELEGSATLTAKWLPWGTPNQNTAPDVVKNESVLIFRYADTDEYYWTTIFREPSIRRLETVCYMYGNLKEPLKQWDKTSSYWVEVSTKEKWIKLHTSKSDGEPFEYDVTIDPQNGYVEIKDDRGNFFKIDSEATDITIQNAEQSVIDMNKEVLDSKTNQAINSETKFTTQTSTEIHLVKAKVFTVQAPGATMHMAESGEVTLTTQNALNVIASADVKITAPTIQLTGNVEITGPLSVNGNTNINGNLQLSGVGTAQSWTP